MKKDQVSVNTIDRCSISGANSGVQGDNIEFVVGQDLSK